MRVKDCLETVGRQFLQKSQESLEKVSQGRAPKGQKKPRKRSEKSKKKSENGFLETFRTFFETFSGLLGPRARRFRDFFETFWLLAPRLLLPGPWNLNPRGTLVMRTKSQKEPLRGLRGPLEDPLGRRVSSRKLMLRRQQLQFVHVALQGRQTHRGTLH